MIQKSISLKNLAFGKGFINPETIFLHRSNIIAIVAPNSLIEGHVWICSRRSALKLDQLTEKEALDLWMTANEVSRKLEETLYKKGCQIFMHDGLENPNFQHVYIQLTPNSLRGSKEETIRTEEELKTEALKLQTLFDQCYN